MASEFPSVSWTGTRTESKPLTRSVSKVRRPVSPPAVVPACAIPAAIAAPSIRATAPPVEELPPISVKPPLPPIDDEIAVPYTAPAQDTSAQIADPLTALEEDTAPVEAADAPSAGRSGRGRRSSYRSGRGT